MEKYKPSEFRIDTDKLNEAHEKFPGQIPFTAEILGLMHKASPELFELVCEWNNQESVGSPPVIDYAAAETFLVLPRDIKSEPFSKGNVEAAAKTLSEIVESSSIPNNVSRFENEKLKSIVVKSWPEYIDWVELQSISVQKLSFVDGKSKEEMDYYRELYQTGGLVVALVYCMAIEAEELEKRWFGGE